MRHAIAIDLGGTQLRAALVAEDGAILARHARPTPAAAGAEAVLAAMADAALRVSTGADGIIGVAVSSPGPLDTVKGMALGLPSIQGLDNFPLRAALEQGLGHKVWLENDGIAAAIGEWIHGAGRGLRSLVYVTISTGIGGGVIVDGQVLRGRMGMAGHVGHMCIDPDGPRCKCGNAGCWEALAAGPAFAARAQTRAAVAPTSLLHGLAGALEPAVVFAAAANGDALARELVAEEARLLGIGVTSLLHLYSPEAIIVGGGLANAFSQLRLGIMAHVSANAMPPFRDVPVVKAGLGGNSGLLGAASLAFAAKMSGR